MRLTVDVTLPGDGWAGSPAVDCAAVLTRIAADLLGVQREATGCDLAASYGVQIDGEHAGFWSVVL